MSIRKSSQGFTLVELTVVITLIGILSTVFIVIYRTSLVNYLGLQKQASSFGQLSSQADRIANILRGTYSVELADDNELTVYAYLYPVDTYVSKIRYYVAISGSQKQLKADITPMTANPPLGTPITAKLKTAVLIDNFYQPANSKLFIYINALGTTLSTPVSDLSVVKTVQINLSTEVESGVEQTINLQVLLRNKKNNL